MTVLKKLISEIEDLAENVESVWKQTNFDLNMFPKIAADALNALKTPEIPSLQTITRDLPEITIPHQNYFQGMFSDFPFTLVAREHFSIDLYYWFRSDTSIHNHHFCGAFKVVQGTSYQVDYSFKEINDIDPTLKEGELVTRDGQMFPIGKVQEISPQDEFIHHVFHLDQPTVTLCIRTPNLPGLDLWSFIHPCYKIKHMDLNQPKRLWLNSLRTIQKYDKDHFPEMLESTPLLAGDVLRLIIQNNSGDHPLDPVLQLLIKSIKPSHISENFFDHLQNQFNLNQKHKKFGHLLLHS